MSLGKHLWKIDHNKILKDKLLKDKEILAYILRACA